jgi:DNA-binding transcriptional MocR family regulator
MSYFDGFSLTRGLRQSILSGAWRNGERIPSTRDLADQLGVSRTIVVLAYDQLTAEGFVTGRGGSGTFVSQDLGSPSGASPTSASFRLSRFGAAAEANGPQMDFPARKADQPVRYDFAYGKSDIDVFPFETWRRILLRNARKASVRDLDYGPASGSVALRGTISRLGFSDLECPMGGAVASARGHGAGSRASPAPVQRLVPARRHSNRDNTNGCKLRSSIPTSPRSVAVRK